MGVSTMPRPGLVTDHVCLFCDFKLTDAQLDLRMGGDYLRVHCPVCGTYLITGTACDSVPHWELSEEQRAAMAFAIRRMTDRSEYTKLTNDLLRSIRDTATLPRP